MNNDFEYYFEDDYWETGEIPSVKAMPMSSPIEITPVSFIHEYDNVKYEFEYLENDYLVHYWVEDDDYVMTFIYDEENDTLAKLHIENIDRIPYENIEKAYEYFDKLEPELLEICRINNLDI